MRQVQISEELFSRLYGFHVLGKQDALQAQIICDQLQEKMDRIQARAEYSARVTPEPPGRFWGAGSPAPRRAPEHLPHFAAGGTGY